MPVLWKGHRWEDYQVRLIDKDWDPTDTLGTTYKLRGIRSLYGQFKGELTFALDKRDPHAQFLLERQLHFIQVLRDGRRAFEGFQIKLDREDTIADAERWIEFAFLPLAFLLHWRVGTDDAKMDWNGPLDDNFKEIVRQTIGPTAPPTPTTALARIMADFSVQANAGAAPAIAIDASGAIIYELIQQYAAAHRVDWDVVFDADFHPQFRTWYPRRGTDRTESGPGPDRAKCIFSDKQGNFVKQSYGQDTSDLKTVMYDRLATIDVAAGATRIANWGLREGIIDSGDTDEMLVALRNADLKEWYKLEEFKESRGKQWQRHFFVGDDITWNSVRLGYGPHDDIVAMMEYEIDEPGFEHLTPTFGKPEPDIRDNLRGGGRGKDGPNYTPPTIWHIFGDTPTNLDPDAANAIGVVGDGVTTTSTENAATNRTVIAAIVGGSCFWERGDLDSGAGVVTGLFTRFAGDPVMIGADNADLTATPWVGTSGGTKLDVRGLLRVVRGLYCNEASLALWGMDGGVPIVHIVDETAAVGGAGGGACRLDIYNANISHHQFDANIANPSYIRGFFEIHDAAGAIGHTFNAVTGVVTLNVQRLAAGDFSALAQAAGVTILGTDANTRNLILNNVPHLWPAVDAAGALISDGAGTLSWGAPVPAAHDILSLSHGDTLAAGVIDGDVIIGNVTPRWSRLAVAIPGAGLRNVLGIDNGELRPSWKPRFDAVVPDVIQCDDAAATGAAMVASRRDHTHGIVTVAPVNIGNANAEGAGTSFVRSTHVHNHPAGLGTDLHHAEVHVVNSTGPHAEAGLTIGHVLRVTGAAAFSFGALIATDLPAHNLLSAQHGDTVTSAMTRGDLVVGTAGGWDDLAIGAANTYLHSDNTDATWQQIDHTHIGNVLANQHHAEVHVVNSAGPHAEAGLTIGHALRVTGAAAFSFAQLQHGDLGGVGAADHQALVTIGVNLAANLLGLAGQALSLDNQIANLVFSGPAAGGAAAPTFRALVAADLPAASNLWTRVGTSLRTTNANDDVVPNAGTGTLGLIGDPWDMLYAEDITLADGGIIRCAGAPVMTFDDTGNTLDITGAIVDINRGAAGVALTITGNAFIGLFIDQYAEPALRMVDGIEGRPAYSFLSDVNSGMWSVGSDILGFSTHGVQRFIITDNDVRLYGAIDLEIYDGAPGNLMGNWKGATGNIWLINTARTRFGGIAAPGYLWPAADGAGGAVLSTNGAGTLTWVAAGAPPATPWTDTGAVLHPTNARDVWGLAAGVTWRLISATGNIQVGWGGVNNWIYIGDANTYLQRIAGVNLLDLGTDLNTIQLSPGGGGEVYCQQGQFVPFGTGVTSLGNIADPLRWSQVASVLGNFSGDVTIANGVGIINTGRIANRNVLISDGTRFQGRALVAADLGGHVHALIFGAVASAAGTNHAHSYTLPLAYHAGGWDADIRSSSWFIGAATGAFSPVWDDVLKSNIIGYVEDHFHYHDLSIETGGTTGGENAHVHDYDKPNTPTQGPS